jgi:hypothetical protein
MMSKFQNVVTRREPARDPSSASDVTVPFLQAVIPSVLATGIVAVIGSEIIDGIPSPKLLLVVFLAITLLVYIGRSNFIQSTLMKVEQVTQRDLDGDGQIGKPKHPMVVGDGWQTADDDGPSTRSGTAGQTTDGTEQARLEEFLAACYRPPVRDKRGKKRRPNSVSALRDAGFTNDTEIEEFRDLLMRLGLGEWRNPNEHRFGWRLTAQHKTALQAIRSRVDWI